MITGTIYAAVSYFVALLLTAVGAWLWTGGDLETILSATGFVARIVGPFLIVWVGFLIGFFREKHRTEITAREAQIAARRPVEAAPMTRSGAAISRPPAAKSAPEQHVTDAPAPVGTVRPLGPPPRTAVPVREISPEVQDYLKQTSRVDLKGIKDYIEETRTHSLGELHRKAKIDFSEDS